MKKLVILVEDAEAALQVMALLTGVNGVVRTDVSDLNGSAPPAKRKRITPVAKGTENIRRRWTNEDGILALEAKDKDVPKVAKKLGRTNSAVYSYRWAVEMGHKPDPRKEPKAE